MLAHRVNVCPWPGVARAFNIAIRTADLVRDSAPIGVIQLAPVARPRSVPDQLAGRRRWRGVSIARVLHQQR